MPNQQSTRISKLERVACCAELFCTADTISLQVLDYCRLSLSSKRKWKPSTNTKSHLFIFFFQSTCICLCSLSMHIQLIYLICVEYILVILEVWPIVDQQYQQLYYCNCQDCITSNSYWVSITSSSSCQLNIYLHN